MKRRGEVLERPLVRVVAEEVEEEDEEVEESGC